MRPLTPRVVAIGFAVIAAAGALIVFDLPGALQTQDDGNTPAPTTTIHPAFRPQPTFDDPTDDPWPVTPGTIEPLVSDEADQADACESADRLRESARELEESAKDSHDPMTQAIAEQAAGDAMAAGDACVSQLEENASIDIYGGYGYEDPMFDRP